MDDNTIMSLLDNDSYVIYQCIHIDIHGLYMNNRQYFEVLLDEFINEYRQNQNDENYKHDFKILLEAILKTIHRKSRSNEGLFRNCKGCYKAIMKTFNSEKFFDRCITEGVIIIEEYEFTRRELRDLSFS